MTATYWEIGRRIVESEMRGENRADYGEQLVEQLASDSTRQFGRGFGRANLWQMRGFYRAWPEQDILQTPSGECAISSLSAEGLSLLHLSSLTTRFPLPWSAYVRHREAPIKEVMGGSRRNGLMLGRGLQADTVHSPHRQVMPCDGGIVPSIAGMQWPCGSAVGLPSLAATRSSNDSEMKCSKRSASSCSCSMG